MNKERTDSGSFHDGISPEKDHSKKPGIGSSNASSPRNPNAPAICVRKNNLSKSLQKFFHRRHSYSFRQESNRKGKKLFESINDADGEGADHNLPARRSSRARVWSVRNSYSKSPVETVSKDLLKFSTPAKVKKKYLRSRACSYAFDVLHSFNEFLLASGDSYTVKTQKKRSCSLQNTEYFPDQNNVIDDRSEDVAGSPGDIDDTQDRSRLSSFGSSACYSDTSNCCCSFSSCCYCNIERSDSGSVATETDVSTSYWDLRLPIELSSVRGQIPRRYSLDVATEHQITFGSPDIRAYLAKRRLSEQPSMYTGQNRMNQCWQDKFLSAMGNDRCFSKQVNDITEQHIKEQSYGKGREVKGSIDIPRIHRINEIKRSNSACAEIRRSKSITRNQRHRTDEKELPVRTHLQRSRSADSSYRRKVVSSRERRTSKSPTCQFAFSDIESSEESESTQDPKESSSEERQQSSLNDTSSLSACSVSGSSSNERNTPATRKRNVINDTEQHIADYSINDTGTGNVEEIVSNSTEEDYSHPHNETDISEIGIDIARRCNDEIFAKEAEIENDETDGNIIMDFVRTIKQEEIKCEDLEPMPESLDVATENSEEHVDNHFNEEIVFPQESENAQAEKEVIGSKHHEICEEVLTEGNRKDNIESDFDCFGTDVDALFEEDIEAEEDSDLYIDEKDAEANNTFSIEIKSLNIKVGETEEFDPSEENRLKRSDSLDLGDLNDVLFDENTHRETQNSDHPENSDDTIVLLQNRTGETSDFNTSIRNVNDCGTCCHDFEREDSGPSCHDFENEEKVNDGPEIDDVLNYFDSVLKDEVEVVNELDIEKARKSHSDDSIEGDDTKSISRATYDVPREEDESKQMLECSDNFEQCAAEKLELTNGTDAIKVVLSDSMHMHANEQAADTVSNCAEKCEDIQMAEESMLDNETALVSEMSDGSKHDNESTDNTDGVSHESEKSKASEMMDESVQVEERSVYDNSLEFRRVSLEEILFSSGRAGTSAGITDDVDDVFEAINREVSKEENKDKDMMVMFLVGGELKVLRKSGTLANGSHGDIRQPDFPSMTRKEPPQQNGSRDYIFQRTVHDINRGRPKSAIIVTRSQSFNGMANQQAVIGGRRESPQGVVLGESFRHHRGSPAVQPPRATPGSRGAVGFSFKKSPKVPKVPRPNRALLMFQSVKRGIREFIEATKEDVNQLQHRETDHTSTAQQIKSAERYLKRLEFHLAKLDELHEFYMLQQQLREGVRTMHRAYVTSPGNQSHSLSNVKYGYKECTQNMCNIEAQLEAMMGTFNCKLKGMAGFARLCPGDVFEVTVRHGTQKWKTKGRIEKTGNQKWDIPEFNFKAVVGDIFNIKGLEVRAFKSVLLGQKSCETKDLFSANPQLMTVSINVNGSLKLSIVITWNPLDGVDESFAFLEAPQKQQGTPRRRPVSVIALNGQYDSELDVDRRHSNPVTIQQTKDDNFILRTNAPPSHVNNVTSYHGLDSPRVSGRLSEHLPEAYRQTGPLYSQTSHHIQAGFHSSPALPAYGESDSDKMLPHLPTQNSAFSNTLPTMLGHLHFPSVSPHAISSGKEDEENSVLNIEDVLHTLTSSLEDYHGQYTELQKLEDLIKFAQKLIRKQFRSSSRSSSISVSIESALEAFDFLDTEEAFEEPRSPTDNVKASFDDMLCSPESTAKTGDSGIESLAQRLSEDTQLGSSLGSSPVPPSTGNEEVDQCLMYHLTYCERLLENLGAFGPLKCREIYALDKLQKQCTIIESLLKLAKAGPHVDLHSVMSGICEDKSLREFWVKCTDQNTLYIHPDRLLNMMEQKYSAVIAEKHMIDPVKVCQHVITRVLDIPDYETERGRSWFVLTLHQFMLYFNDEGGLKHIENVAQEMKLVEKLTSGNPDIVIKAILTLRDTLPSSPCLKVIGMLLVTMDKEVEQCTLSYLNLIQKRKENRDKALITFVEGLEDRTPEIRSGACAALAILEATESLDQLVYLWQSDSSTLVQRSAKDALLKLGDEGRKAFEDAQLSKHGFQGIQVHK